MCAKFSFPTSDQSVDIFHSTFRSAVVEEINRRQPVMNTPVCNECLCFVDVNCGSPSEESSSGMLYLTKVRGHSTLFKPHVIFSLLVIIICCCFLFSCIYRYIIHTIYAHNK